MQRDPYDAHAQLLAKAYKAAKDATPADRPNDGIAARTVDQYLDQLGWRYAKGLIELDAFEAKVEAILRDDRVPLGSLLRAVRQTDQRIDRLVHLERYHRRYGGPSRRSWVDYF